jgi:transcriptional regulator with XRE-family HTH domain
MHHDNQAALKQIIGRRVRELRKASGLKQQALTEMLGAKSHSTISEVELGRRLPSRSLAHALATFFDVPVGYFLGDSTPAQHSNPETLALKAWLRSELAAMQSCHDEMAQRLQRATARIEQHA